MSRDPKTTSSPHPRKPSLDASIERGVRSAISLIEQEVYDLRRLVSEALAGSRTARGRLLSLLA